MGDCPGSARIVPALAVARSTNSTPANASMAVPAKGRVLVRASATSPNGTESTTNCCCSPVIIFPFRFSLKIPLNTDAQTVLQWNLRQPPRLPASLNRDAHLPPQKHRVRSFRARTAPVARASLRPVFHPGEDPDQPAQTLCHPAKY